MNRYIGFMIRQRRLEKNLSQEGLCKGICVVSYLSKIEQGLVNPGEEIIEQLFAALGIHFLTDEEQIKGLRKELRDYFDAVFHQEDTEKLVAQIESQQELYESCELNLSWQIYQLYHKYLRKLKWEQELPEDFEKDMNRVEGFTRYMEQNQMFLFSLLMGRNTRLAPEQRMHWYNVAQQQIPCSIVLEQLGHLCFKHGKYLESIRFLEQAYHMAAEEGNANVLLDSSFMLATCYTNHDLGNMIRFYRRTMELARVIRPEMMHSIYYNIGATYVEHGQYEEAIEMLLKVEELLKQWEKEHADQTAEQQKGNNIDWLLVYHKLSFSYMQLGSLEKSQDYLRKGYSRIREYSNKTVIKMLNLIGMRQKKGYEELPEYEALLREVYDVVGAELGYGFRKYHGKFLVELYKHKRRYKEALEITEEIAQSMTDQMSPSL